MRIVAGSAKGVRLGPVPRGVRPVSDAAREWLADTGYDPAYGARPLRRLIPTSIGDPLARLLLSGEVVDGSTVRVDRGDQGLTLTPA